MGILDWAKRAGTDTGHALGAVDRFLTDHGAMVMPHATIPRYFGPKVGGWLADRITGLGGSGAAAAKPAPFVIGGAAAGPTARSYRDIVGPPPGMTPDTANQRMADLHLMYQQQADGLRDLFQFAETPEEQARLAFVLGDLEEQRKAAVGGAQAAYGEAQGKVGARAGSMRQSAAAEGTAMGDIYRNAAAATQGDIDAAGQLFVDSGVGVGAGAAPISGNATDFVGILQAAAPREEALARQLGNIGAQDLDAMAASLAGESAAQQTSLSNEAQRQRGAVQVQHGKDVGERIGREQDAYRQQMLGLQQWAMQQTLAERDRGDKSLDDYTTDERKWNLMQEQARLDGKTNAWPTNDQEWTAKLLDPKAEGYYLTAAKAGAFGDHVQALANALLPPSKGKK